MKLNYTIHVHVSSRMVKSAFAFRLCLSAVWPEFDSSVQYELFWLNAVLVSSGCTLIFSCSHTGSMRDAPQWTSNSLRKNSLESNWAYYSVIYKKHNISCVRKKLTTVPVLFMNISFFSSAFAIAICSKAYSTVK